jgi:hypothetical protein
MQRTGVLLLALLLTAGCSPSTAPKPAQSPPTLTSFDNSPADEQPAAAHAINFKEASLDDVLDLYAKTSHRSIIRGQDLPATKFTFSNETPMTRVKVLQALDTVLAAHGIVTVPEGTDYIKILNEREGGRETPPIFTGSREQLPQSSTLVIYAMDVKSDQSLAQAITPFAHLPNSVIYVPGDHATAAAKTMPLVAKVQKALGPKPHSILILRDYSANVRKMLEVVDKVEGGKADNQ